MFLIYGQKLIKKHAILLDTLLGFCNNLNFKVEFGYEILKNYKYGILQKYHGNGMKDNIFANFIQVYCYKIGIL